MSTNIKSYLYLLYDVFVARKTSAKFYPIAVKTCGTVRILQFLQFLRKKRYSFFKEIVA